MTPWPKFVANWIINEGLAAENKFKRPMKEVWPDEDAGALLSALYHGVITRATAREMWRARWETR
jgi:Asp-tRNA(Asn)/Glu-tRNA(Gln) amidotransferase B subunit